MKPLSSHPQNIADPDLWRAGEDALEPRTQGAYVTYTNFIVCRYICRSGTSVVGSGVGKLQVACSNPRPDFFIFFSMSLFIETRSGALDTPAAIRCFSECCWP